MNMQVNWGSGLTVLRFTLDWTKLAAAREKLLMVCPHREHLSYLEEDIKHLERAQMLAMQMVTGFKVRRQQADLPIAFKIFTGKMDCPTTPFFHQP